MGMNMGFIKNRFYSYALIILLLAVIFWAVHGMFSEEDRPESVQISVIVENSSSPRWIPFRLGVERAAKDYQVDLNQITTGRFTDDQEAWSLIEQKVQDGADGLLLSPGSSEGFYSLLQNFSGNSRIMLVNAEPASENREVHDGSSRMVSTAALDYAAVCKELTGQLMQDCQGELAGKKLLLLSEKADQAGSSEILRAFKNFAEEQRAVILGIFADVGEDAAASLTGSEADIVIALDDGSLLQAAKELQQMAPDRKTKRIRLYGIGLSEPNVYYLEQGIINGMIVPNDYRLGYESMAMLAEAVRNRSSESGQVEIEFRYVRPEEVHLEENEKLLFPLVQ